MNFNGAIQIFLPTIFMLQKIILIITSVVWSKKKVIVVVKGDKNSNVVIMKKSDYVTKLDTMIDEVL